MKTKMKRILSFMLVVIMLISVVPTMNVSAASATSKGTCGKNLTWKINSKGTLTISGSGKMYNYGNKSTNSQEWYKTRMNVKKIVIKDGVESIGNRAFINFRNLVSVEIPDSVKSIGTYAFANCEKLEKATLPDSITSIGEGAFRLCSKLQEINIPKNLKTISKEMLRGCKSLTEIVIPDSVTTIKSYAFTNCRNVEKIVVPDSVTYIGKGVFKWCSNVKEITLSKNIKTITYEMFRGCKNLTEIVIPNGVTKIDTWAFYNCSSLRNVNVPASVEEIARSAFYSTSGVENINIDSNNPYYSSIDGVLCSKDKTELISYPIGRKETTYVIPSTIKTIGANAFSGNANPKEIVISESVTRIKEYAFSDASLTTLTIPNTVKQFDKKAFLFMSVKELRLPTNMKTIPSDIFSSCKSIESLIIPEGVETIEEDAFKWCDLKKVTIPSSLKNVKGSAFFGNDIEETYITDLDAWCKIEFKSSSSVPSAKKLYLNGQPVTNLVIPQSVTKIKDYTFIDFGNIESVEIPEGVTDIGSWAFNGCGSLKKVTIPSTVKRIGSNAFSESGLLSLELPNGVEEIDYHAFSNTKLQTVKISKTVTKIGESAFVLNKNLEDITVDSGNPNYTSIKGVLFNKKVTKLIQYPIGKVETSYTVPKSVTKIEEAAFKYSKNLESVKMSKNLKTIGNEAFYHCKALKKISLPDSVKTLGEFVFGDCYKLESVKLSNNIKVIPGYAFVDCHALSEINMPNKLTDIHYSAFENCRNLKKIKFPITLKSIGSDAFAGCKRLKNYEIPASVTDLGSSVIGCYYLDEEKEYLDTAAYKNVKIKGYKGSAAEKYAKKNKIKFVALKEHTHKYDSKLTIPATTSSDGGKCSVCSICGKAKVNTKIAKIKSVKLSQNQFIYNGEKQKPKVTVKDTNGKTLKKGTDYTVEYSKGCKKIGQYDVTVTFKGKYEGKERLVFTIVPETTSIKKLTAGDQQFTVTWKKQPNQTSGYKIQYSTSKNMDKNIHTVKVDKSKTSKTITKLKSGKTYYVRVCTYATYDYSGYESIQCSPWSNVKSIKVN